MRLVFPPVPAALLMFIIYIPLAHILPVNVNESRALLAGALIGYIAYDLTHYYLHHGSPKPGSYFGNLKTYHVAHHFVNYRLGMLSSHDVLIRISSLPIDFVGCYTKYT